MVNSSVDEPSWVQEDENTPLFGTGPVSLHDHAPDDDDESEQQESEEEETIISKVSKASSKTSTTTSKTKVNMEDWHDDEAPNVETRIIRTPRKNWVLHFFHWFEGATVISCIGVMVTQIIPIVVVPYSELGFLQSVLRVYISLFCVLFILVELHVPFGFLQKSFLLQAYFSRGFFHSFLGVIGMEEAYSGRVEESIMYSNSDFHVAWAPLFMQISSWGVFVIGCLYMIFGICCLQVLRDNLDRKHKERVKEFKQLA